MIEVSTELVSGSRDEQVVLHLGGLDLEILLQVLDEGPRPAEGQEREAVERIRRLVHTESQRLAAAQVGDLILVRIKCILNSEIRGESLPKLLEVATALGVEIPEVLG